MRLDWSAAPRFHEAGVEKGVLYSGGQGTVWGGLVSVTEKISGEVNTSHYFDGVRSVLSQTLGDLSGSIEAFTYPDEFERHTGFSDKTSRLRFGLSYRLGSELHVIYNAVAVPSDRNWATLSGSADPSTFAWDISATPLPMSGMSPASHMIMNLDESREEAITHIEDALYGSATIEPHLPTPQELEDIFEGLAFLRITYNGDGTWTAAGPDDMLQVQPSGRFFIQSPTAVFIDEGTFSVRSN